VLYLMGTVGVLACRMVAAICPAGESSWRVNCEAPPVSLIITLGGTPAPIPAEIVLPKVSPPTPLSGWSATGRISVVAGDSAIFLSLP